jgi:hypothetical protein
MSSPGDFEGEDYSLVYMMRGNGKAILHMLMHYQSSNRVDSNKQVMIVIASGECCSMSTH